jgi:hypothetical protein
MIFDVNDAGFPGVVFVPEKLGTTIKLFKNSQVGMNMAGGLINTHPVLLRI